MAGQPPAGQGVGERGPALSGPEPEPPATPPRRQDRHRRARALRFVPRPRARLLLARSVRLSTAVDAFGVGWR